MWPRRSPRRAAGLLLLTICLACRKHAPPALVELPPAPPPAPPSGEVRDGVFVDAELPFSIRVPPGWEAIPGRFGQPLRVSLQEVESELGLEVWAWIGGTLGPRPRDDCDWGFQDSGHYPLGAADGAVVVATCSPPGGGGDRVFGWYIARSGVVYALEGRVPDGELGASMGALDAALTGFAWR